MTSRANQEFFFFFSNYVIGDTSPYQGAATTLITVSAVIVCLVTLLKWYCAGGVCQSKTRLNGKIKFIGVVLNWI